MDDQVKLLLALPQNLPNQGHGIAGDGKPADGDLVSIVDEPLDRFGGRHKLFIHGSCFLV
jgi:hypothetical protein